MSQERALTDPERWESGEFDWEPKTFYFVPLPCLFGTPRKLFEAVQQLRAEIATKEYKVRDEGLMLMEPGTFKGRLMIEIVKPGDYDASIVSLDQAHVFSDVHMGPLKTVKKSVKEMEAKIQAKKGMSATRVMIWDFRHGPMMTGQRSDRFVIFGMI